MQVDDPTPKLDRIGLPHFLVDGIHGMQINEGVVTLNMTRKTFGVPGSEIEGTHDEAVMRLSMSVLAYMKIVKFLTERLEDMAKDGWIEQIVEKADDVTTQE